MRPVSAVLTELHRCPLLQMPQILSVMMLALSTGIPWSILSIPLYAGSTSISQSFTISSSTK